MNPELIRRIDELEQRLDDLVRPEVDDPSVPVYDWVPAQGLRAPGVKAATYVDHGISGAWEFSDGQEEIIVCNVKVPDGMDLSKDSWICLGWSSPTVSQDCDWEVAYLITAEDEDTTAAADATVQSFEESSGNANGLVVSPFLVAGGTITAVDVCFHINVMRDGNDANDDLGAAAHVHGVAIRHYKR